VATLVKRTTQPYLTDVTVDWGGLKVEGVTPARVPDVYAGLPLVLAARYLRPGKGTVTVRARTAGQKVELSLPVTLPGRQAEPAVAHLWARRTIEALMALDYRDIHAKTRAEVTRLGLQFGLVTEFTSYVAVDRTRVVVPGGATRTVVQPAETPEGVNLDTAVAAAAGPQGGYASGGGSSPGPHRASSGGRWGGADLPDLPPWLPVVLLFGLPAGVALIRRRRGRA
jgi:Ca-activated chloride channel family protein